jgi:molybdopterin-guanine dinucleotide biosynthesis protein B
MRSIISIVGKSDSGKTTLLEKLIAELKQRDYKVAVVKHSHHTDALDTAEKDTWRFTQAGSVLSAINSLDHLAIYRRIDHFFDPREISSNILWDYDIILTEGFKGSPFPKIEVHRAEQGSELLTDSQLLLAVVTDKPLTVNVPQYTHDDVSGIADLIENKIKSLNRRNDIDLVVNGTSIPVSPLLQDVLTRTLLAMIPGAQTDSVKSMHVSLRRNY